MDNVKKEVNHVDLRVLWRRVLPCLRRFWALALILAVLNGTRAFIQTKRSYYPMYKSEALFSVSVGGSDSGELLDYSYYYNSGVAKQAVTTFPYLLESDVMRELICQKLGTSSINGSISASSIDSTNFFLLTVTSSSAEDAYDIIRAVMEVYPQVSQKVIGETQLVVKREPTLATEPFNSSEDWKHATLAAAERGLLLGLAIILVMAAMRRTVIESTDMKKVLNLSCLARIPNITPKKRKSSAATGLLITQQEPDSAFCEAFRMLRLKLQRQMTEEDKVLMFTSTLPSEGKSSLAANTALALTQNGKRVLLVDADLRAPSTKATLGITQESVGLSEYLSGEVSKVHFLRYQDTSLYLFAGDEANTAPSDILRREVLEKMMEPLRDMFDYVVLDTPPCEMMADAITIGAYADRVIYVIREDYAPISRICDCVQSLSESGANVCGYVLNRASTTGTSHYGYGYGYGKYGYGYDRSKQDRS